jgi:outer membrane murein-binding lipoprotein Lpp
MLNQRLLRFSLAALTLSTVVSLTGCKSDSEYDALSAELKSSKEEIHLLRNSRYELQIQLEKYKNYMPAEVAKARVHKAVWILECHRMGLTNSIFTPCKFGIDEVESAIQVISEPVEFDWPIWIYNARAFWVIIFALYVPVAFIAILLLSLVFRFTTKTISPAFWYLYSEKFRGSVAMKWSKAKDEQKLAIANLRSAHQIESNRILQEISDSTKKLQEITLKIGTLGERIAQKESLLENLEGECQASIDENEMLKQTITTLDSFVVNEINRLAKHKISELAKEDDDLNTFIRELHKKSKSG